MKHRLSLFLVILSCSCAATDPVMVCHRGAGREAPENTLPAIERGILQGCDWIEVDIRNTRDGQFVLLHDPTLERTTTGMGPVKELTIEQLRSLDAGVKFSPEFSGARVPRLSEVLQQVNGRVDLLLDLKTDAVSSVAGLVQEENYSASVIFLVSKISALREIKEVLPNARTCLSLSRIMPPGLVSRIAQDFPDTLLMAPLQSWTPSALREARQPICIELLGKTFSEDSFKTAWLLQPAAILTDSPTRFRTFASQF